MKTLGQLFSELNDLGVHIWLEGDKLLYRCPENIPHYEWKSELAKRKAEIISFLSNKHSDLDQEQAPIYKTSKQTSLPLSFAQQRMWFQIQFQQLDTIYNMPVALKFDGMLDIVNLESCLNELVNRHEVLRVCVQNINGEAQLKVNPYEYSKLPIIDLSGLSSACRDGEADRLARREAELAIDLTTSPLFRIFLLRSEDNKHTLLWTLHHIVTDRWSHDILARELGELYRAFSQNQPSPLLPLAINYSDYIVWQREQAESLYIKQQLEYWKQKLANPPASSSFPTDFTRPALQNFVGAKHRYCWGKHIIAQLRGFSRQSNVSVFMLLHTALLILLHRYSNNDDIIIGTIVANRNHNDTKSLVGHFLNVLALRADLSDNPTVADLLSQVRHTDLSAFANQEVAFEQVFECVQPHRSLSLSPLFQVLIIYQNIPGGDLKLPGVTISKSDQMPAAAYYDVTITVEEAHGELNLIIDYNSDLFKSSTIDRLISHYRNILLSVTTDPQQRISQLNFLDTQEVIDLIGSDTTELVPEVSYRLEQVFARRVEMMPDSVALIDERSTGRVEMSYRELDESSWALAYKLKELGVGVEQPVAVCLDRSFNTVVALLAVLKVGAAYVPLDPSYPVPRLEYILQDSRAIVAITQRCYADVFTGIDAGEVLFLDDDELVFTGAFESDYSFLGSESAAYIIYTSGSTGVPKGVVGTHLGVLNRLRWMWECYPFEPDAVCCHKTRLSFVDSVWEIFGPLLAGIPAVIIPEEVVQDPGLFIDTLTRHQVSRVVLVPSLLRVVLEAYESLNHKSTMPELWIVSGEELSWELVDKFRSTLTSSSLLNLYGSSEVAADATCYCIDNIQQQSRDPNSVPIGRPLTNVKVYILDPRGQLAAPGVVGELCVAGAGLARGYYQDTRLTAERFVPNPFDSKSDYSRLFRTGDLGRYMPDGTIVFSSRQDYQVKLRGFRIELMEVEAVLRRHPEVRQAAVVLDEDEELGNRLLAYVQCSSVVEQVAEVCLDDGALRSFMVEQVPDYMVPSLILRVNDFVLTPSGKVDRLALPQWQQAVRQTDGDHPQTQAEQLLAGIWEDVLRVEGVGLDAHFFNLGGHSLLATQLVARVNEVFDVELPIRKVFELPNFKQLSDYIQLRRQQGEGAAVQRIKPFIPKPDELPLSYAQQRMWFLMQLEDQASIYNLPLLLRLKGDLDTVTLELCLHELVRRHEVLRASIQEQHRRPYMEIAQYGEVSFPLINLQGLNEIDQYKELERLSRRESELGFDYGHPGLFRVLLIRLGTESHVLLWTLHHIVTDRWSNGVLAKELSLLYEAFTEDQASPLPKLELGYSDYVLWQRDRTGSDEMTRQLAYWQDHLSGSPITTTFPSDYARPARQTFRGSKRYFRWSEQLVKSIESFARGSQVTVFMVLHALLVVLLHRYTGSRDTVLGAVVANRTHKDLEPLVGHFLNMLALRTRVDGQDSFKELLEQIQKVDLGAFEHQEVAFEQVIEAVEPQRSLSQSPLFQILLIYQNTPMEELSLSDLEITMEPLDQAVAYYDMTFMVEEEGSELVITVEYNSDLFRASTIDQLIEYLECLATSALENSILPISELSLLSPQKRLALINQARGPKVDYQARQTFVDMFETQAASIPNEIAAICNGKVLTYFELNRQANMIARRLIDQGAKSGITIGLLADRELPYLAAMIGILKSAGAYLPLDPEYPQNRVKVIITESKVPVIICMRSRIEELESTIASSNTEMQPRILCLESLLDYDENNQMADSNPQVCLDSDGLAYVIFTSGSTGVPKGAMITHKGLRNTLCAKVEHLQLSSRDKVAQSAKQSFDISVWQFLGALIAGGCVTIFPNDVIRDPRRLIVLVEQNEITVLEIIPSMIRAILSDVRQENGTPPSLSDLRWLIPTGEALDGHTAMMWFDFYPAIPLLNAYGPAECADDVTIYPLLEKPNIENKSIPIGKPIANTSVYILDERLEIVPTGIAGELFVQGDGVGRGYLNDPLRTAEYFIPNPFSEDPGDRLYRTGDIVVALEDGNFEFLGRSDHQIKFRGMRAELGEIESILATHPQVAYCAVMLWEIDNNEQLVAFIEAINRQRKLTAEGFKIYLRDLIPNYLIPAVFTFVEKMPLTASGKIDKTKLVISSSDFAPVSKYVPPGDELEKELAQIWQDVLGVEKVGIYDNFFALGGHSFLALTLVTQIEQRFAIALELRMLFDAPNVFELAKIIRLNSACKSETPLVALTPKRQGIPLIIVHPVGGDVLCYEGFARYMGEKWSIHGLQSPMLYDDYSFANIQQMAQHYLMETEKIRCQQPYVLAGWSFGGLVAFEMAQQLNNSDHNLEHLLLFDLLPPQPIDFVIRNDEPSLMIAVVKRLGFNLKQDDQSVLEALSQLQPVERFSHLVKCVEWPAQLAVDISSSRLEQLYNIHKFHWLAESDYVPQSYEGKTTLYIPDENIFSCKGDSFDFWNFLISDLNKQTVPGNHYSMFETELVKKLASCVDEELALLIQ